VSQPLLDLFRGHHRVVVHQQPQLHHGSSLLSLPSDEGHHVLQRSALPKTDLVILSKSILLFLGIVKSYDALKPHQEHFPEWHTGVLGLLLEVAI